MDGPKLTLIPIEDIQTEVGKFYKCHCKKRSRQLKRNTKIFVLARQVAMYLAREMTDNSLPKIGKEFGGRDHSTVLHAYNKIKNMMLKMTVYALKLIASKTRIK